MRILLVSTYFPPQPAVASLRCFDFARSWAEAGEQVTVLTTAKREDQRTWPRPSPGFRVIELPYAVPRWLEALRRSGAREADEEGAGAGDRTSPLRRVADHLGVFASLRKPDLTDHWVAPAIEWGAAHGPWDAVVSSSGPYTAHLVALALKKRGAAATWAADFRDLWVQNHAARGLFPFTLLERAAQRRCLGAVDLVSTVSEGLASNLRARTAAPVAVVYNGYDPDEIMALDPAPAFPDDGRARLVYTGSTYTRGQDPATLLGGLAQLRSQSPRTLDDLAGIVVAGRGGDAWRDAAQRLGVADLLDLRGVVSRDLALRMQRDALALVLLDWDDPRLGVLTGKLFEYLAAGPPIIVAGGRRGSPAAEVAERSGRGVHCVTPERVAEVLAALLGGAAICPQPDRDVVASFARRAQSLALLARLREVRARTSRSNAAAASPLVYDQPA